MSLYHTQRQTILILNKKIENILCSLPAQPITVIPKNQSQKKKPRYKWQHVTPLSWFLLTYHLWNFTEPAIKNKIKKKEATYKKKLISIIQFKQIAFWVSKVGTGKSSPSLYFLRFI